MSDWTTPTPYLDRMNSAELWQDPRVEPKPNPDHDLLMQQLRQVTWRDLARWSRGERP